MKSLIYLIITLYMFNYVLSEGKTRCMSLKPTQKSDCTEFDMTDEAPYNSCCFTIVTIEKTAYMCYPGTDNEIDDQYKTTLDTYATNYSYNCTRCAGHADVGAGHGYSGKCSRVLCRQTQ